ncbi:MAG: hypothetical protein IJ365_05565 [Clostridia bacterium]|nr:hypothetical protein [Clostridia bacterium]
MAVKTYQDSKDKYLKEKVDTFVLRVPKGKKDEIAAFAASKGMSLNGYITSLVFTDMGVEVETAKKAPAKAEKSEKVSKPATKKAAAPKKEKPAEPKKEPRVIVIPAEPDAVIDVPEVVEEAPQPEAKKKRNMPSFLL